MGRTRNRVLVFFVGILTCLVVLEVSLRIVGSIYANLSEPDERLSSDAGQVILCVGDSLTFGLGASSEFSYPAQLQKMLSESNPEKNYLVINRGWPGQNTAELLIRLEKYLREFKPSVVTLLIGARNQANYFGYKEYLQESHKKKRGLFLTLHDQLDTIRLYKFFRLLFRDSIPSNLSHHNLPEIEPGKYPSEVQQGLKELPGDRGKKSIEDCFGADIHKEQGEYDKALEFVLDAVETKEVDVRCYSIAGSIYREQKQYEKALTWFRKGIKKDPTEFRNYDGIGQLYSDQNQLRDAVLWYKKGFEQARYSSLYGHCYVGINDAFKRLNDFQGAIEFFEKETKRKAPVNDNYLSDLANDYLMIIKNNESDAAVLQWIQADLEQILELCDQYKSRVIIQNYPFKPGIDPIFRKIAKQRNIPFVDHQTAFAPYIKDGVRSKEYFVPDEHPNEKGYHLMAKNIWMVFKRQSNYH